LGVAPADAASVSDLEAALERISAPLLAKQGDIEDAEKGQ